MDTLLEDVRATTSRTMAKMVFDSWYSLLKQFNAAIDSVTDEQLQREIAPGRNRGIYVLGHMVAVHDDMLPILGFGPIIFQDINEVFKAPDDATAQIPSASELRIRWKKISDVLDEHCRTLQPDEWFQKHNSVSAEDFATQPHRNKLNVMISRTCHLAHHLGQVVLIK